MVLSDALIADLLADPKPTLEPTVLLRGLSAEKLTMGHRRHAVAVTSAAGRVFRLHLRQSPLNPYDFSVILTYLPADGGEVILRRHNGSSHQHRNAIEGDRFRETCHVHIATERYQLRGSDPDGYAEPTDRFHDLATAVVTMLIDASFQPPAQLAMHPIP